MKKKQHEWWLRLLLGIIALNISLLSLHTLGLLPARVAQRPLSNAVRASSLPVDAEGVLRVRLVQETVPVRIEEINSFVFGKLPVEIKDLPLRVQIDGQPVQVRIKD